MSKKAEVIYAVPEYLVKKEIQEKFIAHIPVMSSADSYGYSLARPTTSELAEEQGVKMFDPALPQGWVDDFVEKTGFNPVGHFVYSYDEGIFGHPKAVTREGIVAHGIYDHIVKWA